MPQRTVIGEIGGSSSRWAWSAEDGKVDLLPHRGATIPGFNPLNGDRELFISGVRTHLDQHVPDALGAVHVHAYGAGCGSDARKQVMAEALQGLWPDARIAVATDLEGAARGLLGNGTGLVLILGTGMNVGYFDQGRAHRPMPSLGYILGDEGSGADIGRCLLQDAFYRRMPEAMRTQLFGTDGPELEKILDGVHREPFPARFLAAFTGRCAPHREEAYVRELIGSRFAALAELLASFFSQEQRREVFATGSVAYGFREILADRLLDRGMTLTEVVPDPLPGLVRWHAGL